jgi:hypothetical protein
MKAGGKTMVERQVIEGTWEEVSVHAAELRGRRVRLTVLPDEDENEAQNGAASARPEIPEAFSGLIGGFRFGDANLSEATGEKFADLLVEKLKESRQ